MSGSVGRRWCVRQGLWRDVRALPQRHGTARSSALVALGRPQNQRGQRGQRGNRNQVRPGAASAHPLPEALLQTVIDVGAATGHLFRGVERW